MNEAALKFGFKMSPAKQNESVAMVHFHMVSFMYSLTFLSLYTMSHVKYTVTCGAKLPVKINKNCVQKIALTN